VAFVAGKVFMLPVQLKIGFIMIKLADFPVDEIMTPVAICDPVLHKLVLMRIFMTI